MALSSLIEWLGLSKQALGALIDVLVLRGYVERSIDPEDRRRLLIAPSARGIAAGAVVTAAGRRIDTAAATAAGSPEELSAARRVLTALAVYSEGP